MCFKKSIFVSQLQSITFHQTVFNGIKYIVTNTENTKIHIPVKDNTKRSSKHTQSYGKH